MLTHSLDTRGLGLKLRATVNTASNNRHRGQPRHGAGRAVRVMDSK